MLSRIMKYILLSISVLQFACAVGEAEEYMNFPHEVVMKDALPPHLRGLPTLDLSIEAAEAVHLDWEGAPEEIKTALKRNDIGRLLSSLKTGAAHDRWYAAHALGRVRKGELEAKIALRKFLASQSQARTKRMAGQSSVMERFMEDAVESEAKNSLHLLPNYAPYWWGGVSFLLIVTVGLMGRIRSKQKA